MCIVRACNKINSLEIGVFPMLPSIRMSANKHDNSNVRMFVSVIFIYTVDDGHFGLQYSRLCAAVSEFVEISG